MSEWYTKIGLFILLIILLVIIIVYFLNRGNNRNTKRVHRYKKLNKTRNFTNRGVNIMSNQNKVSRLLNVDVFGQDNLNNESEDGLSLELTKEIQMLVGKKKALRKLARLKVESVQLDQMDTEIDIILGAIDVEQKIIDFKKLSIIAKRLGQPIACVLIDKAPACVNYVKQEDAEKVLSLLMNEEEAYSILATAELGNISDISEIPFRIVDDLISLYFDFDLTEEVYYITEQLVVLQLKGKVRKSKRSEYLDLLQSMTTELSGNDYVGLSDDVDDFKAAENALNYKSHEDDLSDKSDDSDDDLPEEKASLNHTGNKEKVELTQYQIEVNENREKDDVIAEVNFRNTLFRFGNGIDITLNSCNFKATHVGLDHIKSTSHWEVSDLDANDFQKLINKFKAYKNNVSQPYAEVLTYLEEMEKKLS